MATELINVETIPYANRAEWLQARRQGVGGSDAAAAVGVSKWMTRLELWQDKRGERESNETAPMHWGNLLEPVVRQEYVNQTGRTVIVPNAILRHPSVRFALLNADGIADNQRLYEGKTARTADGWGEPGSGDIPMEYLLQVQHGMFVTGLSVADVAVLIGGSDFRIYTVEADRELQDMLIEQEAEFWRLVEAATPPEPINRDDVKRRWQIASGAKLTANPDVFAAVKQLASAKQLKGFIEDRIDELTAFVQSEMKDAEELTAEGGQSLATWKNINASPRFDQERFKEEQPELFKQYLKPANPQRRFLVGRKVKELSRIDDATRRLVSIGGELTTESESGSRYFDMPGGLIVRLSDHAPNEATAAWMDRCEVASVRVDEPDWAEQVAVITGPVSNSGVKAICQ